MKLNWGSGLLAFIVFFVLVSLGFLFYTTTVDIDLVEQDYYPKELRHEEHLSKIRNANSLRNRIVVTVHENHVSMLMPEELHGKLLTGEIHVYRPSDERLDFIVPVSTDTAGIQLISRSGMVKGKYILKVDWSLDKTRYYQETEFYIP